MNENIHMEQLLYSNNESTYLSRCRQLFHSYDRDNDGKIPLFEMRNEICKNLKGVLPNSFIEKIITEADNNRDGYITADEFIRLAKSEPGKKILMQVWLNSYVTSLVGRKNRKPVSLKREEEILTPYHISNDNNPTIDEYPPSNVVYDITDGEYEDEYSCCPPPILMISMSIIQLSLFLYDSIAEGDIFSNPVAKVLIYNPHRKREAWRFVTYMFIHAGWGHLLVNILVQVLLALPLEMVHGWWRILSVYLMGVIFGALGTSIMTPKSFLAGASGGVYSIITAHLAVMILNWAEMEYAIIQLLFFCILMGTDTGFAIYRTYILNIKTQVGYMSHFCGALAGLLFGLCLLRNLEVHSWEKKLKMYAFIIFSVLLFGSILWTSLY